MQVEDEKNIEERDTRYLIAMSNDELKKGEDYIKTRKTIVISILNFNYLKRNSFLNVAHMKFEDNTEETHVDMGYIREEEIATKKLEMITIELPKFKKRNPDAESELNKWLWLIIGREDKIKMAKKESKNIKKAIEIIDEMSMNPKEWEMYRARQMAIMNYKIGMSNSREEGRKEGEKKSKFEVAKKMISKKIKIKDIAEFTGLKEKEIEKLKNNI